MRGCGSAAAWVTIGGLLSAETGIGPLLLMKGSYLNDFDYENCASDAVREDFADGGCLF